MKEVRKRGACLKERPCTKENNRKEHLFEEALMKRKERNVKRKEERKEGRKDACFSSLSSYRYHPESHAG